MNAINSLGNVLRSQHFLLSSLAQKEAPTTTTVSNANVVADKVSISSEGQLKSDTTALGGVEQYALPSWFTEFAPAFSIVSNGADERMEEAKQYNAFHEKLAADGQISAKDLDALKSYVDTMMPANSQRKHLESDYSQNRALYQEYGSIHQHYLNESLAEQRIETQEDWNKKVLNAPDENQELRLSIMEKMFKDPRAMELMNILNIQRPTTARQSVSA